MKEAPAAQVLVVEDEAPIRALLATTLTGAGYRVIEAASLREGMTLSGNRRIDLFIIDLGLPDGDGYELITSLRRWTQRPIIVLSARSQEKQKVAALDAGADDYLAKPFGVAELHARLRVALRNAARSIASGSTRLTLGDVVIDLAAKSVRRGNEPIALTATQWRLLEALARHAGRVVTSATLLRDVWGPGHERQGHYLRIYVHHLRQKLEADPTRPVHLLNETGIGYRLVAD
ncbi:MAG TPA: response regulator [Burkholderiaceae bacterium]|nr:response regulator [Burkholderiaceae bacterium]